MKEKKYPSHTLDKFQLRFPDGMRELIKQKADDAGRSMNAEIIYRLEQSFLGTFSNEELPTADQARALAAKSRDELKETALILATEAINDGLRLGRTEITFNFEPLLDTNEGDSEYFYSIVNPTLQTLTEKGYKVEEDDNGEFIVNI